MTSGGVAQWQTLAGIATHTGKTSLVIIDVAQAGPVIKKVAAAATAAGSPFTAIVKVSPTAADLSPTVAAAHAGGAKNVLVLTVPTQADLFSQTAERTQPFDHYYTIYVKNKGGAPNLGGIATLDKYTIASAFPPLDSDNPLVAQYRSELAAEEKTGDSDAALVKQGRAFETWLAYIVLERIVKRNKLESLSAKSVKAALDQTKALGLDGVIPPWSANPVKAPTDKDYPRVTNDRNYVYGYRGGTPALMTSTPITVDQAIAGEGYKPLP
jgi:hypothetical protein